MPARSHHVREETFERALQVFRHHGGILRMSQAVQAGIHRRTLRAMLEAGLAERLSRGLYRLSELPPLGNPDLVTVARRVPRGVICLVSALAYHELTTQVPHEVYLALPRGAEPPRIDHPPTRVFWFHGLAFSEGIEGYTLDEVAVPIYSPEKTLADCFKYRNKIGTDVAVEALRLYRDRGRMNAADLVRFARVCRVENVMRPYLEALM